MAFIADLHIHSRFSRATSKQLNPAHLAGWAAVKGIDVLGSGDFTHPGWRAELAANLVRDEASGLYRLAGQAEMPALAGLATSKTQIPQRSPLFCLQTEISSIYKRGGKVRKIHNLVFVPDLDAAERLSQRLGKIGNLTADGRPILGLDSRDLLEITLETVPDAVLIPAHVWTPWFALFGSRSGFDRLEDCFADLSGEIFALETGLSSDPAMNRLVSQLDKYVLVSNSDAHSGANLGREANLFEGQPSYHGIFAALRRAARRETGGENLPEGNCRFLGTLEFYPEEGKYHLDGHRACNVVLSPEESKKLGNICPVCGKPLTVGVLHRVMELADRVSQPELVAEPLASSLIPLPEILSELLGTGAGSKKVQERQAKILADLGPELGLLWNLDLEIIRNYWDLLGEAIARMRSGRVILRGGYDGEYGVVRLFDEAEARELGHGGSSRRSLPLIPHTRPKKKAGPVLPASESDQKKQGKPVSQLSLLSLARAEGAGSGKVESGQAAGRFAILPGKSNFSAEQLTALTAGPGPVLVLAGPGAGKTRVLVGRLAWLLGNGRAADKGLEADKILALTFTRRAAAEIRERIGRDLGAPDEGLENDLPLATTLHGLAHRLMAEADLAVDLLDEDAAFALFASANPDLDARQAHRIWYDLQFMAEKDLEPDAESAGARAAANYARAKEKAGLVDYGDLLLWLLQNAASFQGRWQEVLVDEVQDLSPRQLAILKAILPADGRGFFGIGDPDQSIYGFRGASGLTGGDLAAIWPGITICRLEKSYRSSQSVLDMANSLLLGQAQCGRLAAASGKTASLRIFVAPGQRAEASWIAENVQNLLGCGSHTLMDAAGQKQARNLAESELAGSLAPDDIAILVRVKAQAQPLLKALQARGIPAVAPEEKDFLEAGDNVLARAGLVRILTIHAAKGLEFEAVFLPGLEDGLLPLRRDLLFGDKLENASEDQSQDGGLSGPDTDEKEERRLFYVGLTRAARAIYISRASKRILYGKKLSLAPSPYLEQVSHLCLQTRLVRHTKMKMVQQSLLG